MKIDPIVTLFIVLSGGNVSDIKGAYVISETNTDINPEIHVFLVEGSNAKIVDIFNTVEEAENKTNEFLDNYHWYEMPVYRCSMNTFNLFTITSTIG